MVFGDDMILVMMACLMMLAIGVFGLSIFASRGYVPLIGLNLSPEFAADLPWVLPWVSVKRSIPRHRDFNSLTHHPEYIQSIKVDIGIAHVLSSLVYIITHSSGRSFPRIQPSPRITRLRGLMLRLRLRPRSRPMMLACGIRSALRIPTRSRWVRPRRRRICSFLGARRRRRHVLLHKLGGRARRWRAGVAGVWVRRGRVILAIWRRGDGGLVRIGHGVVAF